jgi:hypothetical protein
MDVLLCLSLYLNLNIVCFKTVKTEGLYVPELLCYVFFCVYCMDCSWHSINNENNTANSIVRDCCSHLQFAIHCLKWDFGINSKTSQS